MLPGCACDIASLLAWIREVVLVGTSGQPLAKPGDHDVTGARRINCARRPRSLITQ